MKQRRAFSLVLAIFFSFVFAFSDLGTVLYVSGLGSAVKAAEKQEKKFDRYYYALQCCSLLHHIEQSPHPLLPDL